MLKAIQVEGVSKQYRLGQVGTGSIAHDLNRFWHSLRGKEDPYLKIGEANDRTKTSNSKYVWSLKDVSFDIQEGDAVGIIGTNGAGKSTLLKILSRVTAPTKGSFKAKGRIASLLEVGTGFHPELTGKENVYLNGAILGMRKKEIASKFDEIVDFAGVERYIDTPVKRYSSGMYVRLAFAVAAHLESEILIVDEVLAVGDAEFQKKCLGKMSDVTKGEGRTVLFVSHNMASIKALCNNAILLDKGKMLLQDKADKVAEFYSKRNLSEKETVVEKEMVSDCGRFVLELPFWVDTNGKRSIFYSVNEKMTLRFNFFFKRKVAKINPGFAILNMQEQIIFTSHLLDDGNFSFDGPLQGNVIIDTVVDIPLAPGFYKVIYGVRDEMEHAVIYRENVYLNIQQTVAKNAGNGILWYTSQWSMKNEPVLQV